MEYIGCWYCDCKGDAETQVEADKEADEKGAEDKDINAEIGKDKIMDKEEAAEIIRKLREKKLREKSMQVKHIAA